MAVAVEVYSETLPGDVASWWEGVWSACPPHIIQVPTHVGQMQTDVKTAREALFDDSILNKMRVVSRTVLTSACAEMVQGDPQHRQGTGKRRAHSARKRTEQNTLLDG